MTASEAAIIVRELAIMTDASWSFRDSKPVWRHRLYGSSGAFDPFPAYPHQTADVNAAVKHVQACFPPLWNVELYVADREEEGRSNGYSSVHEDGHYDGDGDWVKDPPVGLIMLSGKRVPPHPAVSRYLVAHEYGHNVEWMLNQARGAGLYDEGLIKEYVQVRGLAAETLHHGSGGTWHDSVHEIFACDFRILVCDVETAYWPHPGIPHPHEVEGLAEWWADTLTAARQETGPSGE